MKTTEADPSIQRPSRTSPKRSSNASSPREARRLLVPRVSDFIHIKKSRRQTDANFVRKVSTDSTGEPVILFQIYYQELAKLTQWHHKYHLPVETSVKCATWPSEEALPDRDLRLNSLHTNEPIGMLGTETIDESAKEKLRENYRITGSLSAPNMNTMWKRSSQ